MERVSTEKMNAVADLYIRYAEEVKAYFCAYTRNANIANALQQAEDMTHDLFMKVIGLDMVNSQTVKSLLFVMARRMMIDDARHRTLVRQTDMNAVGELYHSDAYRVENQVDAHYLHQVEDYHIARMPEKSARVYQLYFHEDQSTDDIVKILQMNKRTVEGHIYRCRKEMREAFRKVM